MYKRKEENNFCFFFFFAFILRINGWAQQNCFEAYFRGLLQKLTTASGRAVKSKPAISRMLARRQQGDWSANKSKKKKEREANNLIELLARDFRLGSQRRFY